MDKFLKYHADTNTYIIRRKAFFEDSVRLDGNVIIGSGANFWKDLEASGSLELGKASLVKGNVKASDALISTRCEIGGNIDVTYNLTMLDNVKVAGHAICGNEMSIRPGCEITFAKADTALELIGKVNIKEIESATKLIVRSDM
ncbi:polymer-forming cytoskeletal protein [Methanococcoides sp. AM1]|uniref:polymer-forming cytoskeletal protein n=1 Tax=Methanococcoides sp. AM1 TaxID=1201011 RepID=UPI001FCEED96|nr:polymer-forming cytoskeletal protein [Methanococcoides sp. AM1]